MIPPRCRLAALVLLAALGCQTPETSTSPSGGPRPLPPTPARSEGRTLLQTGSMQLGPGVGRNLWGWQGDGLGGF